MNNIWCTLMRMKMKYNGIYKEDEFSKYNSEREKNKKSQTLVTHEKLDT